MPLLQTARVEDMAEEEAIRKVEQLMEELQKTRLEMEGLKGVLGQHRLLLEQSEQVDAALAKRLETLEHCLCQVRHAPGTPCPLVLLDKQVVWYLGAGFGILAVLQLLIGVGLVLLRYWLG